MRSPDPTKSRVSWLVGNVKQNRAPRGELSAAHKRPPSDSIMDRLIPSPIPVPCAFVVKNALKISSACCDHVDDSAGDGAEFREVVVRLNLEFLYVVDDGSVVVVSQEREIIDSIKQEHVASVSLSIYRGKGVKSCPETNIYYGVPCVKGWRSTIPRPSRTTTH